MKLLLLGCSSIAGRRLLPALDGVDGIDGVDAASRRGADAAAAFTRSGSVYATYDDALDASDAALVYISTENSEHGGWAARALDTGRHVILDKPALADRQDTAQLVDRVEANGLVIAEATVFLDHPRIAALDGVIARHGPPAIVQACFSFPPLPADNFRYDPDRGGGAINDLGPYAAATWRHFIGAAPDHLDCRVLQRDRVETGFSVTASMEDGRCFSGIYGFNTAYQNWVSVAGDGYSARLDRFCTPPPGAALGIALRQNDEDSVVDTDPGDCFASFLSRVAAAIDGGTPDALHAAMLSDAAFRDRLRERAA